MDNKTNLISVSKKDQTPSSIHSPNSKVSHNSQISNTPTTRRSENSSSYDISPNEKSFSQVKVYSLQRYLTLLNLRDLYLLKALHAKQYIEVSEWWIQIVQNFKENHPSLALSLETNTTDFSKEYLPAFLDFLDTVKNNQIYFADIKQSANPLHNTINQHLDNFKNSYLDVESEKSSFIATCFLDFFTTCPLLPSNLEVSLGDFQRLISILKDINKNLILPIIDGAIFDEIAISFIQSYFKSLLFLHRKKIISDKGFAEFFPTTSVDRILIACSDSEKPLFDKVLKILKNTPEKHSFFLKAVPSCLILVEQISKFLNQITLLAQSIGKKNVKQHVNGVISNNLNLCSNFILHELICSFEKVYLSVCVPKKEMQKRNFCEESDVLKIVLQGYRELLQILQLEGPFDKYRVMQLFTKIKEHIQELSSTIENANSPECRLSSPAFLSLPPLFIVYLSVIKRLSDLKIIDSQDEKNLMLIDDEDY